MRVMFGSVLLILAALLGFVAVVTFASEDDNPGAAGVRALQGLAFGGWSVVAAVVGMRWARPLSRPLGLKMMVLVAAAVGVAAGIGVFYAIDILPSKPMVDVTGPDYARTSVLRYRVLGTDTVRDLGPSVEWRISAGASPRTTAASGAEAMALLWVIGLGLIYATAGGLVGSGLGSMAWHYKGAPAGSRK